MSNKSSSTAPSSDPPTISSSPNPRKRPSYTPEPLEEDPFENYPWDEADPVLDASDYSSDLSEGGRAREKARRDACFYANVYGLDPPPPLPKKRKTEPISKEPLQLTLGAKSKAKPKPKTTIKYDKSVKGHCSLTKKDFGDSIKECLAVNQYDTKPTMFYVCPSLSSAFHPCPLKGFPE
jgi:hypothetical protein